MRTATIPACTLQKKPLFSTMFSPLRNRITDHLSALLELVAYDTSVGIKYPHSAFSQLWTCTPLRPIVFLLHSYYHFTEFFHGRRVPTNSMPLVLPPISRGDPSTVSTTLSYRRSSVHAYTTVPTNTAAACTHRTSQPSSDRPKRCTHTVTPPQAPRAGPVFVLTAAIHPTTPSMASTHFDLVYRESASRDGGAAKSARGNATKLGYPHAEARAPSARPAS